MKRLRVLDVRPEERAAAALAFLCFALLLSGYYMLRPVREAWGIEGGTASLPWLFTATFATTLVAIPIYSWVVARVPRRLIVPAVNRFIILNILVFHVLLRLDVPRAPVGRVFFVWISVVNLYMVAAFWSLAADRFHSGQARRLFGAIAGGGSLGALVGPFLSGQFANSLGLDNLLLLAAVLLELSTWCAVALARGVQAPSSPARGEANEPAGPSESDRAPSAGDAPPRGPRIGGSIWAGVTLAVCRPFLRLISLQMLCMTSAATFLYLLQAELVYDHADVLEDRLVIFAHIDLFTSGLGLFLQLFVAGALLTGPGVGFALRSLSVLVGAGLLALAVSPVLIVIAVVQVLRRAAHYAVERPALNLLYTVVGPEERYKAKGAIDTVVYRGGDAAAMSLFHTLGASGLAASGLALVALPLAGATWLLAGAIARRHRELEVAGPPEEHAP
ncbi:MAG: NTP/NDP exchange transporter [Planctomycetota bacterium]|jgi:AAA family ATP:ADP antiporter